MTIAGGYEWPIFETKACLTETRAAFAVSQLAPEHTRQIPGFCAGRTYLKLCITFPTEERSGRARSHAERFEEWHTA